MPRSLTARQRRFVEAYLQSRNARQAAQAAGYAMPRAQSYGPDLLRLPHIAAALRERGLEPPRGVHPRTQRRKKATKRPRNGLSLNEERFALAYLICGNATEAARRIGNTSPENGGYRFLQRPHVAAFIDAERQASIARTRIDLDRVQREYARLAFSDIADIIEWDEEGGIALKASAAISPDDRAAIAQVKLKKGAKTMKASVKLHDKQRALDALAKMMGLFGKKGFLTIDHAPKKRDANAILRERLLKIAQQGEKKEGGEEE